MTIQPWQSHWCGGTGMLTLCEIVLVSDACLEYGVEEAGFEMETEGNRRICY